MNARRQLNFVLVLFLGFVAVCGVLHGLGFEGTGFAIEALGAIAVVFAVTTALYGDSLRDVTQPIELKIERPVVTNNFFEPKLRGAITEDVFCYHLRVRDTRSTRIVKNCRVWLVRIIDVMSDERPKENFSFAVPRLMSWAPSEFSPELRSFVGHQVFDLGVIYPRIGVFEIALNLKQGGRFQAEFQFPERRQYVFQIEVDGLVSAKEHIVQVEVEQCKETASWPYKFRAVIKPQ